MGEGAEGLVTKGSAGGGGVCRDGTGASERIPSSLIFSAATDNGHAGVREGHERTAQGASRPRQLLQTR